MSAEAGARPGDTRDDGEGRASASDARPTQVRAEGSQPTANAEPANAEPGNGENLQSDIDRQKTITISASAAEEIQRQRAKRGTPDAAIRVGIRGGGCTGFSYLFEWDDKEPRETDKVFRAHGVVLFVDPKSFVYLRGTELDFIKSMMGHGFKFNNPNVKGECGCGESVQF